MSGRRTRTRTRRKKNERSFTNLNGKHEVLLALLDGEGDWEDVTIDVLGERDTGHQQSLQQRERVWGKQKAHNSDAPRGTPIRAHVVQPLSDGLPE